MNPIAAALIMTYRYVGQEIDDDVVVAMSRDLEEFHEKDVLEALEICRKTCRGKISMADILSRLPNGHPGCEEAWSMSLPGFTEANTIVRTGEMREAFEVAWPLRSDLVAARMAFKEKYLWLMAQRATDHQPPTWEVSLGEDKLGRVQPLLNAVTRKRIPVDLAKRLLPPDEPAHNSLKEIVLRLTEQKTLEGPNSSP
ncbi:hypothetical protein COW64_08440 [bacterium (Candidatus Blackallbacteria) CG18_big_fil_WC_8_21_14_2_50_49_26]|nr:MAG: hypothetical protein COW64_08440 [bacterium (Candidatus Blackallbacteria) CG18_big_fil_WC_8_21_14_2_50_49_26]